MQWPRTRPWIFGLTSLLSVVLVASCGGSPAEDGTTSGTIDTTPLTTLPPPNALGCNQIVTDRYQPVVTPRDGASALSLLVSDRIADLPLRAMTRPRHVIDLTLLATPDDYLEISTGLDADARRDLLQRTGFQAGARAQFEREDNIYSVIVLRLRDATAAVEYSRAHLIEACRRSTDAVPISQVGGIGFLRDGLARATFVVGDSEINLTICHCTEQGDRIALAGRWAEGIAAQLV